MHTPRAAKLPCRMEEEAAFKAFAAQPNLHEQIFNKVAPNIFGHADIKKAVACLLFGGARKVRSCLLSSRLCKGPWRCTGQCLVAATALLAQCSFKVSLSPASSLLSVAASTGHGKKRWMLLVTALLKCACHCLGYVQGHPCVQQVRTCIIHAVHLFLAHAVMQLVYSTHPVVVQEYLVNVYRHKGLHVCRECQMEQHDEGTLMCSSWVIPQLPSPSS